MKTLKVTDSEILYLINALLIANKKRKFKKYQMLIDRLNDLRTRPTLAASLRPFFPPKDL